MVTIKPIVLVRIGEIVPLLVLLALYQLADEYGRLKLGCQYWVYTFLVISVGLLVISILDDEADIHMVQFYLTAAVYIMGEIALEWTFHPYGPDYLRGALYTIVCVFYVFDLVMVSKE